MKASCQPGRRFLATVFLATANRVCFQLFAFQSSSVIILPNTVSANYN